MPVKSEKNEHTISSLRPVKKPINNKINDITERTRRTILEKFTDEQLIEFRGLFNMFDKDNQSFLTSQDLLTVMRSVGQTPTESDMIDLMREIDLDSSGTIDFYEFVHIISRKMSPNETNQEIRHAFDLFDENHDGLLTFDDLKQIVGKYFQLSINDFELRQMIELADRTNQGHVTFDDFLHIAVCRLEKKRSGISI